MSKINTFQELLSSLEYRKVSVVATDGEKYYGTLAEVRDDYITIHADSLLGEIYIPRRQIVYIRAAIA